MLLRLASLVGMVALLLLSAVPAFTYVGTVQASCVTIYPQEHGQAVQLCSPAKVREATTHSHVGTIRAGDASDTAAPGGSQVWLPLSFRGSLAPYPNAPLCSDTGPGHDTSLFHTLWDGQRGCHYDHEHGQNPFTPAVAAAFPGFDLMALLGGVGVGHTNPSSPMENTHKHGGFKWNVQLTTPENCAGFEGSTFGSNASVVQYHAFGDQAIEHEARIHSTVALVRQCSAANPTDYGYVFVVQFQDYGQRIVPYQGTVVAYPNQPSPNFESNLGPYLSTDCVGQVSQCRASLADVVSHHRDADSFWTSKPATRLVISGSSLFQLLFRVRDSYRLFRWSDQSYPFTYDWLCSSDNGLTFNPAGCHYTNSTTQVHEIAGSIPAEWDNLAGFDTDTRVGRVSAQGYVTRFGVLNAACTAPSTDSDCFPIKLVRAFVGTWGSVLVYTESKGTNIVPEQPSRNIYFCGGLVCAENNPGATPSGWVGPEN
jgi:hypothetical protein